MMTEFQHCVVCWKLRFFDPWNAAQVGKSYAARAARAASKREAEALAAEGLERVSAVYTKGATAVDGLKDMAKALRRLPVVDLGLPTVPEPCPEACAALILQLARTRVTLLLPASNAISVTRCCKHY